MSSDSVISLPQVFYGAAGVAAVPVAAAVAVAETIFL